MLAPVRRIPAIAVAGFRHAGRASVLGALIRQKPKPDRWAVIGAGCGSSQANVEVEEVAPGCPCCSAMLPFRVGLTRLLRRTAAAPPALLLIKGGPEGHVATLRAILATPTFASHVTLERVLAVLDPRWLVLPGAATRTALAALAGPADAIIANKWDLADRQARERMAPFAASLAPPREWMEAVRGDVPLAFARPAAAFADRG